MYAGKIAILLKRERNAFEENEANRRKYQKVGSGTLNVLKR